MAIILERLKSLRVRTNIIQINAIDITESERTDMANKGEQWPNIFNLRLKGANPNT